MELISKLLFWVANSLLIPDIIILLCLFVRSLILIGGTYNMYMTKRKNEWNIIFYAYSKKITLTS